MKVAIIGANGHFGYVLGDLPDLAGVRLVAMAAGSEDEDMSCLLDQQAVKDRSPAAYADFRRMLDERKPDIACVNTIFHLNSEVTLECLRRGIHVFSEKPLAIEMEALDKIAAAQHETGARIGMMLNYRYDPRFYTARKLVEAGVIGEPAIGYAQKSYKFGSDRPWYYRERKTFGGLIPWVGIHAIDWFQWVSGVEYASVTARHSNHAFPDYPGMEDSATCLFELANGGSAVMSFDYLRPRSSPTHGDDRLRLVGTKGLLEISGESGLHVIDSNGAYAAELENPPRGHFADFVCSVERGTDCLIGVQDCIDVTRVALLAREAADTGKRVNLPAA